MQRVWIYSQEQDDGHISGGRLKVSSPTVDSTTDSVVPVMVPPVEKEVTILSEDCSVPSSSVTGDEDHVAHVWKICGSQEIVSVGEAHGEILLHRLVGIEKQL